MALVGDVTEQKRAEAFASALQDLETQFSGLSETTSDVICRYDRACRLLYANSGLVVVAWRPLREMLGKTSTERTLDPQYAAY